MKRAAVLVAFAAAAVTAAIGAAPASATNECRGLMVCVSVSGPWVVVSSTGNAARQQTQYELKCPRKYIVGGLDAELSAREIEISFDGLVGSPVTPGVTTATSVLFRATYVGGPAPVESFRPRLGCVPASGGGGRLPTAVRRVFPPGQVTVRRTTNVVLRLGRSRIVRACGPAERLLRSWYARGFFTGTPPTAALTRAVAVTPLTVTGDRVALSASNTPVGASGGAALQLGAVCVGGR